MAVIDAVALQLDAEICHRIGHVLRMQGLVVICITCDGAGDDDNLLVITQERNQGSMISSSAERHKISSAVEDIVNKIVQ